MSKGRKKPQGAASRGFCSVKPAQSRVLARTVASQSKRWTGGEQGLQPGRARRILCQAEVQQILVDYRTELLEMLPEAIWVYRQALKSSNYQGAANILKGIQLLLRMGEQSDQFPTSPYADLTDEELDQRIEECSRKLGEL